MGTDLVLTRDMVLVLGLVLFTMTMFMFERIRSDATALVVLIALGVLGLVPANELFQGFSGSAVIAIIARSAYKLTKSTLGADRLLWVLFAASGVVTAWTESELIWLFVLCGVVALFTRSRLRAPAAPRRRPRPPPPRAPRGARALPSPPGCGRSRPGAGSGPRARCARWRRARSSPGA